jgi:hypothetical protein
MPRSRHREINMTLTINIGNSIFSFDGNWHIKAFGYEMFWSSEEFSLDRPNGGGRRWKRGYGRWTEKEDGALVDGWV